MDDVGFGDMVPAVGWGIAGVTSSDFFFDVGTWIVFKGFEPEWVHQGLVLIRKVRWPGLSRDLKPEAEAEAPARSLRGRDRRQGDNQQYPQLKRSQHFQPEVSDGQGCEGSRGTRTGKCPSALVVRRSRLIGPHGDSFRAWAGHE